MKKIAIIGTGYVGLVSAVCLAETGKEVFCVDKNFKVIERIRNGISPIYEPGLEKLLLKNKDKIFPTTKINEAILSSEIIFIAVGTPFDGKKIDLSQVKEVSRLIGKVLKKTNEYKVIVIKSTVVPGTTLEFIKPIIEKESGKDNSEIGFCMNPEFLREGKAVEDFMNPDRIVLGVTDELVERKVREVYSGFKDADFFVTNPTTAEMIKYTANTFLALTISYANEISRISETFKDVDSEDVFKGVILDKRISPIIVKKRIIPEITSYLKAGCGFGGSCFPKDVKALNSLQKQKGVANDLTNALLKINDTQLIHILNMGLKSVNVKIKNIGILGLAFKPDTDDIRESPSIKLIEMCLKKKFNVLVHDYIAMENTRKKFRKSLVYKNDPLEVIRKSQLIFVVTSWLDYKKISDEVFEKNLSIGSVVVDARSMYKDRGNKKWRVRVGYKN
jgi:UDPglucose 6-dehydrogenase